MLKYLQGTLMELMEDNLKSAQGSEHEANNKISLLQILIERMNVEHVWKWTPRLSLSICGHSMCISCFNDWYVRAQSCPFCRDSLKRVTSEDLWVLTSNPDVW
ncbi:hypothetical protein Pfo_009296 [Paulownia fortunei]|nr:hypothetical protein Pfo_009296 [Paulownia fortunei]